MDEKIIELINEINQSLITLKKEKRLITGEVRSISAKYFKRLPKDKELIFAMCEQLLQSRRWDMTIIAYDWAYRMRHTYDETTFEIFEHWLKSYISDWWDCDDFCTHAFGELMIRFPHRMPHVFEWCNDENFAVRRAAAVVLILPIRKKSKLTVDPLDVASQLMTDPHDLVQKGYGWMLKVLSQSEPDKVIDYLKKHPQMPRTAFRYALQKLDQKTKYDLMNLM